VDSRGSMTHVVIEGGGFAWLACARKLAKSDVVRVSPSTGTTTTSFNPFCTRWRQPSGYRRCAEFHSWVSSQARQRKRKNAEVIGPNPIICTVTKSGRPQLPGRLPGGGRITIGFLRNGGSTRKMTSPSTH